MTGRPSEELESTTKATNLKACKAFVGLNPRVVEVDEGATKLQEDWATSTHNWLLLKREKKGRLWTMRQA